MPNSYETPQTPKAPVASIKLDETLPAQVQNENQIAQDIVKNKVQFEDEKGNRWYYRLTNDNQYQKVFLKNQDSLRTIILEKNDQSTIANVVDDINKFINNENMSQYFFSHDFNGFFDKIKNDNQSKLNFSINSATSPWIFKKNNANQFSIEERLLVDNITHKRVPSTTSDEPGIAAEARRKIELSVDETGQTQATTKEAVMHIFKKPDYYQFLAATDKTTLTSEYKSTIKPQIEGLVTTMLTNKPTLLDSIQDFFSRYLPFIPPSTKMANYNKISQERDFLAALREIAQSPSSDNSHVLALKSMKSAGVEIGNTTPVELANDVAEEVEASVIESASMTSAEDLVQNIISDLKTTVINMRESIQDKAELKEQLTVLFKTTLPGDSFNGTRVNTLADYDDPDVWASTEMQLQSLCDQGWHDDVAKIPAAIQAFQAELEGQEAKQNQSPPSLSR